MNKYEKTTTIFVIKVMTNSSSNKLSNAKINDDNTIALKAYLTASPEKGKANASLIKMLSKTLGIRKANIEILRGHTSDKKILSALGIDRMGAYEILQTTC